MAGLRAAAARGRRPTFSTAPARATAPCSIPASTRRRSSIELACIQAGYREYLAIKDHLNLPLVESGALVVAWDEEQLARLPAIVAKAHRNDVTDVAQIDRDELRKREPFLSARGLGAVHRAGRAHHRSLVRAAGLCASGPGAWRRDPAPLSRHRRRFRRRALDAAARPRRDVDAGVVINAAGNHGDMVEAINRAEPLRHHAAQGPVRRVRQAGGEAAPRHHPAGADRAHQGRSWCAAPPSATCWSARRPKTRRIATRAEVDQAALEQLIARGHRHDARPCASDRQRRSMPACGRRPSSRTTRSPVQRRAPLDHRGRHPLDRPHRRARHRADACGRRLRRDFRRHARAQEPIWTPVPNLAEDRPRHYLHRGRRRDRLPLRVGDARARSRPRSDGPLPAGDLGGLKRRTRCMMGRCQGFYCSAQVAGPGRRAARSHDHAVPTC